MVKKINFLIGALVACAAVGGLMGSERLNETIALCKLIEELQASGCDVTVNCSSSGGLSIEARKRAETGISSTPKSEHTSSQSATASTSASPRVTPEQAARTQKGEGSMKGGFLNCKSNVPKDISTVAAAASPASLQSVGSSLTSSSKTNLKDSQLDGFFNKK